MCQNSAILVCSQSWATTTILYIRTFSSSPKKSQTIAVTPHSLFPLQGTTNVLSAAIKLPILDISCINGIILYVVSLASHLA